MGHSSRLRLGYSAWQQSPHDVFQITSRAIKLNAGTSCMIEDKAVLDVTSLSINRLLTGEMDGVSR